jgi:excisionase family DNA binding protein
MLSSDIMTLKEVAIFLKVKPVTIYKLLSLKKIPGMKIMGAWRFKKELIEEWIDTDCVETAKRAM